MANYVNLAVQILILSSWSFRELGGDFNGHTRKAVSVVNSNYVLGRATDLLASDNTPYLRFTFFEFFKNFQFPRFCRYLEWFCD